MNKVEKIKITKQATIRDALKTISDGDLKIAFVIDKKGKLLSTLTDGDIRRGLLKGLNIDSRINSISLRKPIVAKKNYSREKLLKIALSNKIYQIPVVDENKRPIGIHILEELIETKIKSNKVVIMAGGKGSRLRPLTKNIPKPMLKVGKKPILQIIIEQFKSYGFKNFILCVNYKSKIIKKYFSDGSKYGVNIEYINEKKRMGTAGGLSLFKKKPNEPFFVINGDLLTNLDFSKILDFHNEQKSQATMCTKEFNIESPYGEVKLSEENIVILEEKPIHKIFVNAGVYILDPKCLDLVPNKYYDMPSLFNKIIKNNKRTISFPLGEYWLDIGRTGDYKKAKLEYYSIFKK